MAGGKETPRQKMIGMMYLVLTALLALNVSKQIIQAFIIINDKIESGNQIIQKKNMAILDTYEMKLATLKATKAGPEQIKSVTAVYNKALAIDSMTREASNFVIMEASNMIKESEGTEWHEEDPNFPGDDKWFRLKPLSEIAGMDNYDIPTAYFVGDASNPTGKGIDILAKMKEYRDFVTKTIANYEAEGGKKWTFEPPDIRPKTGEDRRNAKSEYGKALREALAMANPSDTASIIQIYNIMTPEENVKNHDEEVPWIVGQFDHAPIVAAAAFISSIRGDFLQAESVAQDLMASKAEVIPFKFNKIEPLAFGRTGYINQGDSLQVSAYIAAYDSTAERKIRYWLDDSTRAEANMKTTDKPFVSITDAPVGAHTVYGQIAVKERGQEVWKNWKFPFEVGKPTGAIGMPEMMTLYINYPNKIVASASGYPAEAMSLTGEGWNATVQPGGAREVTMTLSAKGEGGSKTLATQKMKVRDIPSATVFLANVESGKPVNKQSLLSQPIVRLDLVGSPLTASYAVTQFDLIVGKDRVTCPGNRISQGGLDKLRMAQPGMIIGIFNVKYTGPGGRSVSGSFTLQ
jgi:hypothetical protein